MVHLRHRNLLQTMTATIFPPFYRRRAARERYFCLFIVAVRRGNNISANLSSPCSAETIFLPIYRHRAARKQYFCLFIVTARRGNNTFAFLSSSRSAETIFLPFYRHRAAREQYFRVLSSPRSAGTIFLHFSACSAPANTFPNGFGFCRPTASVQKCGENRAGMAAGLMQRGK